MIRLATVFSGIGAIEHALQRMQIKNEIIFACDNGDVSILTKKIDMNIDEIGNELKALGILRTCLWLEQSISMKLHICLVQRYWIGLM